MPERWQFAAMGIVLCYLGGLLASRFLMGIDLMIRNERYWLVLAPLLRFLLPAASWKPDLCREKPWKKLKPIANVFFRSFIPMIALCFVLQAVGTILLYNWSPYLKFRSYLAIDEGNFQLLGELMHDRGISSVIRRLSRDEIIVKDHSFAAERRQENTIVINNNNEDLDKLYMWPYVQVMKYLRDHVPPSSTVLSFRPADMYYSERRMISCFDPRLLQLYREHNVFEAWKYLKKAGIDYLHVPDYYNPTIYNSVVQEIVSRSDLSTLVFSADGTQIYQLCQTDNKAVGEMLDFTPGQLPWTKFVAVTGGRKALGSFSEITPTVMMNSKPLSDIGLPLFQRDWSTTWVSGIGVWNKSLVKRLACRFAVPANTSWKWICRGTHSSGYGSCK